MKKKLLVSFSGGETSAFMAQWLWKHKQDEYDMIFVFANTSQENEETLHFVEECSNYFNLAIVWTEAIINPKYGVGTKAKIVDYKTACRDGSVFEKYIEKYGIPNVVNPSCSRELKERTIRAYAKLIGLKASDYVTAIGIRIDEVDRMNEHFLKERLIYPLITLQKMTKPMINFYWQAQEFRLNLKGYQGNCKVCYKKSLRKLLTIAKESPEKFDWIIAMEDKYENYIPATRAHNKKIKLPIRFFRGNLSAKQIIEMSKQPFEMAVDDSLAIVKPYKQLELYGHELDTSNGCSESCEAF